MGGQREGRGGGFHQRRQSKVRNKLVRCLFASCPTSYTSYSSNPAPHYTLPPSPTSLRKHETRHDFLSPSLHVSLSLSMSKGLAEEERERELYTGGKSEKREREGGTRLMALVSRRQERRRRRSEPPSPPPWSEEAKGPLPPIRSFLQLRMPDSPKQLLLQA